MTPKQEAFVREYLVDLNASAAARRAGYSARTAEQQGPRLLGNVGVAAAIQAAAAERAGRLGIEADDVLRRFWTIANADTRELIEYRRTCCRYCWGKGNRYQRTAGEMERDRESHARAQAEATKRKPVGPFDEKGGVGYNGKREPNPNCMECFGDGVGQAHMRDTRQLSPAAAQLYAGVKQTKEGLEVKAHSQVDALLQVGRHLGMFKDRHEHSGPGGTPLAIAPVFNVTVAPAKK